MKRERLTCEWEPRFLERDVTNRCLAGPIAFLGGGQMAEALIGGLLAANVAEPASIYAADPLAARRDVLKSRFGIHVEEHNATPFGRPIWWSWQ